MDSKVANRATFQITQNMIHEKPTDNVIADRSLHRDNSCTSRRLTHVMDMDKAIDRPPFFPASTSYHDEDDPEVDAEVMHRMMTIDRSSLDDYVVRRKDYAPIMRAVISRPRAGRGHRLLQDDIGMMHSKGFKHPETATELECSVEQSKEKPSRART